MRRIPIQDVDAFGSGVLTVALLVAAVDGEISDVELRTFDLMARKCCGVKSAADRFDAAREAAERLRSLAGSATDEQLVSAFVREAREALRRGGVARWTTMDVRRAVVFWVAMGLADGDYSVRERLCVGALCRVLAEMKVEMGRLHGRRDDLDAQDDVARAERFLVRLGMGADGVNALEGLVFRIGGISRVRALFKPCLMFLAQVGIAAKALRHNLVASSLGALSVAVAIMLVVAVQLSSRGAGKILDGLMRTAGPNAIIVFPEAAKEGGVSLGLGSAATLTVADAEAIERELGHCVSGVSPSVNVQAQLVHGDQNWRCEVGGVGRSFPDIRFWEICSGRFFSPEEEACLARVCVLGQTVRRHLFDDDEDAVGEIVRIDAMPFRVVGELAPKDAKYGGDPNDTVLIPHTTAAGVLSRSKFNAVSLISFAVAEGEDRDATMEEVAELLRDRHRLKEDRPDDFVIRDPTEIIRICDRVRGQFAGCLLSITLIAVIGAGIGVMNIMLAAGDLRTYEIGLRMAVGATRARVFSQFALEAIAMTTAGGLVGAPMGGGLAVAIGAATGWPMNCDLDVVAAAVASCMPIGFVFGVYPAFRAAQKKPVECLLHKV